MGPVPTRLAGVMLLRRRAEVSYRRRPKIRQMPSNRPHPSQDPARDPPGTSSGNESGGFCCQVPPNPACRSLTRQDFKCGLSNCVTQPEQPEQSCRWQLLQEPDNGGTIPGKDTPFTPSSILFRPRRSPPGVAVETGFGGGAGYCPRVRMVYCDGGLFP